MISHIARPAGGPLHVLVANNIYPPIMAGGAELIVAYLCEYLAAQGHRVTVVSTCGPEMEPYPVEQRNGVEVIRFFPRNRYWSFTRGARARLDTLRWHLRDAWNRDAGRRLGEILRQARPDVLHSHLIDGFSATIWRAAKRRGIPVLHTAHDYHLLCPRAFLLTPSWRLCTSPTAACRLYRRWHLHTARDVDLFASPSQFLLDLHRRAGLPAHATAVVHNGIPLPVPPVRPAREGAMEFLLLARLTVEKGVRVVLEAMRHLPPDAPVRLSIAGRGALEAEVRAAAAADPRIRFLGFVQDETKAAALAAADYLLLPSLWYENAPVVVLEAAAHGLGLIASDIGGIPEFCRDGETGFLVPPGDAAALAARMVAAAGDRGFLRRLPQHAEGLLGGFTVRAMAERYLEHYRALCVAGGG